MIKQPSPFSSSPWLNLTAYSAIWECGYPVLLGLWPNASCPLSDPSSHSSRGPQHPLPRYLPLHHSWRPQAWSLRWDEGISDYWFTGQKTETLLLQKHGAYACCWSGQNGQEQQHVNYCPVPWGRHRINSWVSLPKSHSLNLLRQTHRNSIPQITANNLQNVKVRAKKTWRNGVQ